MIEQRKYFIVKLPDSGLANIMKHCIGELETQRRSLDGKEVVVKIPAGSKIPSAMEHLQVYSNEEVREILKREKWTPIMN